MIVDDDEGMRESLALIFQDEGYDTCTAKDGKEAADKARERFFNAAVIDIKLPDTEGPELLRKLKELHAEMAGIMITGYPSLQNAAAALNEGADAYLEKPFAVPQLKATVQRSLSKRRFALESSQRLAQEMREKEHYKQLSIMDELTEVYNYRYFHELLSREVAKARRYSRSLSLLMVDIDGFKEYNDRCGHPAGDEILKKVARILRRSCRETDPVARYGGDEFAIIAPETNQDGASALASRLKQKIEQARLGDGISCLTISIGLASYPSDAHDKGQLIFQADQALYRAKHGGGNRLCLPEEGDQ